MINNPARIEIPDLGHLRVRSRIFLGGGGLGVAAIFALQNQWGMFPKKMNG